MKTAVMLTRVLISLTGILLLVLGILFWTGHAFSLLSLHEGLGMLLVLSLWLAAALALIARVSKGFILLVIVWSLIMPILGVLQLQLLPGRLHWIVQLLHLLVGVAAIGLGHALARRIAMPQRALG